MDRITALDTAFLALEGPHASLNIGTVAYFAGPPPDPGVVSGLLARRLLRSPRLRQRLVGVPLTLGRPVWADDPDFDLAHHVHFVTLPEPGGPAELETMVAQIFASHLDRDRPLWEHWFISGFADDTWAVVAKVHHTMVDGIAGVGLLTALFDDAADPAGASPAPTGAQVEPWRPASLPGPVRLVTEAVLDGWRDGIEAMTWEMGDLRRLPQNVRRLGGGLIRLGGALRPTGETALIGEIGHKRVYRHTSFPITTVLGIREALGGTVNDVVVAAAARGYRDLLLALGDEPAPDTVRVMIPVSVRRGAKTVDNRVSAMFVELPVEVADPLERLTEVATRMTGVKRSRQADAGEWLISTGDLWPALMLRTVLERTFRSRQRNLSAVITNVPGPSAAPLRFADREMLVCYPYVPISFRLRASVAVSTYRDQVVVGVTGDHAAVPDLTPLVDGIEQGIAEMARLAGIT